MKLNNRFPTRAFNETIRQLATLMEIIITMRLIKSHCYAGILINGNLIFPTPSPHIFSLKFSQFPLSPPERFAFHEKRCNVRATAVRLISVSCVKLPRASECKSTRNSRRSHNNEINNEVVSMDRERAIHPPTARYTKAKGIHKLGARRGEEGEVGNGSSIKNLRKLEDLTIRPWSVSASFNESEEPKLSHLTKVRNVMKSS